MFGTKSLYVTALLGCLATAQPTAANSVADAESAEIASLLESIIMTEMSETEMTEMNRVAAETLLKATINLGSGSSSASSGQVDCSVDLYSTEAAAQACDVDGNAHAVGNWWGPGTADGSMLMDNEDGASVATCGLAAALVVTAAALL